MKRDRSKYRPGPGWVHLAGAVWEHKPTMARVHLLGTARTPLGGHHSTFNPKTANINGADAFELIRINGGNRRRGLMTWARIIAENERS